MSCLGEIGQNVNFWVKTDKFWSKKGQKGPKRFLSKLSLGQMSFKYAKVVKSNEQIERNWPKCKLFGKNGQILVKKGPKRILSKLSLGNYSNRP